MRIIYAALMAVFLAGGWGAPAAQAAGPSGNVWRLVTTHTVFFGSSVSVAQTPNFAVGTRRVQLLCTVACLIAFAASGTSGATQVTIVQALASTTHFLPANVIKEYIVSSGQVVAVLGLTATGTLYVSELSR